MNKNTFHKIHLTSLSLAFIGLLFPIKISSICIILFGLASILKLLFFKSKTSRKFNKTILIFTGFYVLFIVGLIYTENIKNAQSLLERNLTWLLAPSLLLSIKVSKKEKFNLLFSFAVATQLFACFYLVYSLFRCFSEGNSNLLYYQEFTSFTGFHPVYFALYLLFSFGIFLYSLSEKYIKLSFFKIILLFILNTLFFILLASKTILGVFFVLLIIFLYKHFKKQKKLIFLPIIISILFLVVFNFSETKNRINNAVFSKWELLKKDQFLYNDTFTGVTLRLITWKFVTKKIFLENNFLIGTGTGDGQDFINNVYKEHNMDTAGYLGFNMHNQYLEYFVRFGFLGLFYFLLIIYISIKKAFYKKDNLYVFFLLIFLIASLTESILEVHRGIVFFTLFNFFFFYNSFSNSLFNLENEE